MIAFSGRDVAALILAAALIALPAGPARPGAPDLRACVAAMAPECFAPFVTEALDAAAQMPEGDARDWEVYGIGLALIAHGDLADAAELAERISEPGRRNDLLSQLAEAQAVTGDSDGLRRTLAMTAPEDAAGAVAVVVARVQARKGDFATAFDTAAALTGTLPRALAHLAIAEEAAARDAPDIARHAADLIGDGPLRGDALAAIIVRKSEAGQYEEALQDVAAISEPYLRDGLRYRIVALATDSGAHATAKAAAEAAEDSATRTVAWAYIVKALAETGDYDAAFGAYDRMQGDDMRNDALGQIALRQARRGDGTAALETANRIRDPGVAAFYLAQLARVPGTDGSAALAAALDRARATSEGQDRNAALATVTEAMAGLRPPAAVRDLARSIAPSAERDRAMMAASEALALRGDAAAATATADEIADPVQRAMAKTLAITRMIMDGAPEPDVEAQIAALLADLRGLDAPQPRLDPIGDLAIRLTGLGRTDAALALLDELPDTEGAHDQLRLGILHALANDGRIAGAREIAETLEDPANRSFALEILALSELPGGPAEQAFRYTMADGGPALRATLFRLLAQRLAHPPGDMARP